MVSCEGVMTPENSLQSALELRPRCPRFIAGLPCNALSRESPRSYVQTGQEFVAGLPCNALSRESPRSYVQTGQEFVAGLVKGVAMQSIFHRSALALSKSSDLRR